MADIVDPDVISFVNERIRPFADVLSGMIGDVDILVNQWNAVVSPAVSGNVGSDPILDGSELDGRTQITKGDLINFITQLQALQTQWDGGGVDLVIQKPSVNVQHVF